MNNQPSSERTVADVITELLRERDLSLLELSEQAGVARVTLRRHLLKGGGDISVATLHSIAQVLQVRTADLLADAPQVGAA